MEILDQILDVKDRLISFAKDNKWWIIIALIVFLILWLGFKSFELALMWLFLVIFIVIVMVIYKYFRGHHT